MKNLQKTILKKSILFGLGIMTLLASCQKDELSEVNITEDTFVSEETSTSENDLYEIKFDELVTKFKNASDKNKVLDEIQSKVGEKIDRNLFSQILISEDPKNYIVKHLDQIDQLGESSLKHVVEVNAENQKSLSGYPTFESTEFKVIGKQEIKALAKLVDRSDYSKTDFMISRFKHEIAYAYGWNPVPRADPHAVYVADQTFKRTGKPQNPVDRYGWEKAQIKMEVIPPSRNKYNTLVKNTPISEWRIIPDANVVRKSHDADAPSAKYVNSGTLVLRSNKIVTISNAHTLGASAGLEFEAGLIFAKAKTTFELNYSYTRSRATATEKAVEQRLDEEAYLNPGERVEFYPCERRKRISYTVKTPFRWKGYVGADYGYSHMGSHFYGLTPARIFRETANEDFKIELQEDVYNEVEILKVRYNKNGQYKSTADLITHTLIASGNY